MTQHIFGLAGLAGSGKSTIAEMMEDAIEANHGPAVSTEVSGYVRAYFNDGVDDNELGRLAAAKKEEEGAGFFVQRMAELYNTDNHFTDVESRHVVISGLRSPEEADALRDEFGSENVTIIGVWTLPDLRFTRKYGDDVSEDHEKWSEFRERNQREKHDWGCVEYFMENGKSDYIISNNGSVERVQAIAESIIENEMGETSLTAEIHRDSPFPNGDNREAVAQYL